MSDAIITALVLLAAVVAGLVTLRAWRTSRATGPVINLFTSIQSLRDIGQLSVFKVVTKEIVTAEDHSLGQFGKKYLQWLMSTKKMAIIFEFDIDFRYDLRSDQFKIEDRGNGRFLIRMPPCFHDVRIRDMRIYDESRSRLLPILLPDLVNDFLGGSFREEDKNQLIAEARKHGEAQARMMITNLQSEVQASAKASLASVSRAFHATDLDFEFLNADARDMSVKVSERISLQN